ncbi:MAG TPA: hypothetical protein ENH91_03360 [Leeuwenhoekiella sp.]|nr:hypothetical protein [Leeuwenhoekiella sp.]
MKAFQETQRFDQWWLRILLIAALLVSVSPLIFEYHTIVHSKAELTSIGTSVLIILALFLTFWFLFKLETRIDEHGIQYRYLPFHRKPRLRSWDKIRSVSVRKYNPILEYGGWGYRIGLRKKRALNVKGNMGIQIIYNNGRQLLLGTQRPQDAEAIITHYMTK